MESRALKVINAVCKNKDVHQILSEDNELFAEWGDAFDSLKQYYNTYRSVPNIETLKNWSPDVEEVETTAPTSFYVDQLKEEYLSNRLSDLILKTAKHLQGGEKPKEIFAGLQKQISKLNRQTAVAHDLNLMDIELAEDHYSIVKKSAEENGGLVGIPTGFKGIDTAYTTGMAPGHLIFAIGFSGNFKSWVAGVLAKEVWKQGRKPMMISMEMTPEAMRNRLYALMGEGSFKDSELGQGKYDDNKMEDFKEYIKNKPEFMVIGGTAGQEVTPNFIQAKIDQYKPDWVCLDYIQLAMDNEKNQNLTARMTALSRELKLLAVNNNIPILAISSVTDNDQGRNKPPTIDQMAWARALEYSADMVFAVHKVDDALLEIVGRKNRFGDLWDMHVDVNPNSGIFKESYDQPNNS